MLYAEITGWGKCLPPAVLSNADLTTFIDTTDEWITSRTGIEERRICHCNFSDMAIVSARRALAAAALDPALFAGCGSHSIHAARLDGRAEQSLVCLGAESAAQQWEPAIGVSLARQHRAHQPDHEHHDE